MICVPQKGRARILSTWGQLRTHYYPIGPNCWYVLSHFFLFFSKWHHNLLYKQHSCEKCKKSSGSKFIILKNFELTYRFSKFSVQVGAPTLNSPLFQQQKVDPKKKRKYLMHLIYTSFLLRHVSHAQLLNHTLW